MTTTMQRFSVLGALLLLIAGTRFHHFGNMFTLPDATLAVYLLAGYYLASWGWPLLPVFVLMIAETGAMDYYAIAVRGVSDWCVSPAYAFLVPTYAVMLLAGRWYATRQRQSWGSLAVFAMTGWIASSLAFLISNGSFYLLSGRFGEMSLAEYASRVAQYYPPYVGYALMYLGIAALTHFILTRNKASRLAH